MSIFNRKQTLEIDYDKLANAIVKAQDKANLETIKNAIIESKEEIKTKELKDQKQKTEQWQKAIGYDKKKPEWRNDLNIFRKLLVIKKKDVVADFANNALLKIAISFLYWLLEYILYFLCIVVVILSIVNYSHVLLAITILLDILAFTIARIVRVARFEIDNINDKNYLISIISTSVSVFALLVTIATIFINR